MFGKLKKKTKKIFQLEKKIYNKKNSSYPNFVFALYTLIFQNFQIILKKTLYI